MILIEVEVLKQTSGFNPDLPVVLDIVLVVGEVLVATEVTVVGHWEVCTEVVVSIVIDVDVVMAVYPPVTVPADRVVESLIVVPSKNC